jgi:exonuclease SbcC
MKFTKLRWKNLFSYGSDESEINLEQEGITFIRGVNIDNDTSNGSGKSSVIDVFVWALYGRPLKDMPIDDVLNTHINRDGCASVEFYHNYDHYEINRYRADKIHGNGVVVKKNGAKDDVFTDGTKRDIQNRIDELLGLDYNAFVSSTIFSSEVAFDFPITTPEKRRNHLESILGLQAYSDYGKVAKAKVKAIKATLEEMIVKEREFAAIIKTDQDNIEVYRQRSINFETEKQTALEKLKEQLEQLHTQLASAQTIQDNRVELEIKLENIEYKIEQYRQKIAAFEDFCRQKSSQKELLQGKKLHQIMVFSDRRDDIEEHECPTCNRDWESKEVEQLTKTYTEQISANDATLVSSLDKIDSDKSVFISQWDTEYEALDHELYIATNDRDVFKTGLQVELLEQKALNEQIKAIPSKEVLAHVTEKITAVKQQLQERENQNNTYGEFIDETTKHIASIEKEVSSLLKKKASEEEELRYSAFWDESFNNDGLKLFVFESVVPILNNRLAFYLPILFDSNKVQIAFDKMMNMTIFAGDKLISYGGLSQGERKRVDISLALSLLDTAQVQYGVVSNVMFFDELMDSSLDSQGVRAAIDVLRTLPIPTIFIMSHRLEISNEFDNVLDIERKGKFSRVLT